MITGTSSGIGKVTAEFFAEKGWNVAATVRKEADFFFNQATPHAKNLLLDVSSDEQCQKAIQDTIETFGHLNVLLNNAGLAILSAFEESGEKVINDQFQANLFGAMRLTRYALPHFRKQEDGLIVSVSTLGGRIGIPFYSLHASSKFALEGFYESLRYEVYPFNIRIKIIEPGSYQSRIIANGNKYSESLSGGVYVPYLRKHEEDIRQYDAKRGDPTEVAQVIWEAVNDPSNQLRYLVGDDAFHMDKMRRELTDEQLFLLMGKNFQPMK